MNGAALSALAAHSPEVALIADTVRVSLMALKLSLAFRACASPAALALRAAAALVSAFASATVTVNVAAAPSPTFSTTADGKTPAVLASAVARSARIVCVSARTPPKATEPVTRKKGAGRNPFLKYMSFVVVPTTKSGARVSRFQRAVATISWPFAGRSMWGFEPSSAREETRIERRVPPQPLAVSSAQKAPESRSSAAVNSSSSSAAVGALHVAIALAVKA